MASSLQQRRKTGRRYLLAYGWAGLVACGVVLVLLAERYFTGVLAGEVLYRYAAGVLVCSVLSVVLIWAAKSK